MIAAAKSQAPLDLKPLTALRFFAAIWVVSYHFWPALTHAPMPTFEAKGYLGVELFFVLSGFILSHVYLQAAGEKTMSYRSFLWARLSRIYPLHLATLLGLLTLGVAAAALGVNTGDKLLAWSSLPGQIFLLQAWGVTPQGGWNHPAWSISAEWFAYLTFPAFAAAAWAVRDRPLAAVAAAAVFVEAVNIGFERIMGFRLTEATILWGALRIVPCFALGCAAYLAFRRHALTDKTKALAAAAGSSLLVVTGAVAGAPDPVMVLLFGLLIFSLGSLTTAGSRLGTSRPAVWLGEVSFAVYMVCIPWMLVVTKVAAKALHLQDDLLPWPVWAAMFVGVVPVAAFAHHLIERPARAAMRALEQRRGLLRRRLGLALRQAAA